MDSTETDRRIEEAREAGERAKETADFLASLKVGDDLVKPIYNPEAYHFRSKAKGMANRGELPRSDCEHPFATSSSTWTKTPASSARAVRPISTPAASAGASSGCAMPGAATRRTY